MRRSARSIPATSSASGRTCCAPNVTTAATMRRSSTWRPIPACTSIRRRRRERRRRPRLLRLRGSIRKAPATGWGLLQDRLAPRGKAADAGTRPGGPARPDAAQPANRAAQTVPPAPSQRDLHQLSIDPLDLFAQPSGDIGTSGTSGTSGTTGTAPHADRGHTEREASSATRPTMRPSGRNTCGCSPLPRARPIRMRSRPTNRRRMPRARRRPMNC